MGEKKKINIDSDDDVAVDSPVDPDHGEIEPPESKDKLEETPDDASKGADSELLTAKSDAKNYYDRLLRVSAEFENYKKRTQRETGDFRKFANESLVKDLLPVVDNLERAIESASSISTGECAPDSLVEGITLTLNEILKIFERYHVKPIESVGQKFDPFFHQAMMQEEVEDKPDNIILKELQKGYMIHERLLRPAMVVVSKAKQDQKQTEDLKE